MVQAADFARQSVVFFQKIGAQKDFIASQSGLYGSLSALGELEQTERLLRESNALCRSTGDLPGLGAGLYTLAGNLRYSGKYAEAIAPYEEAAVIWKKRRRPDLIGPGRLCGWHWRKPAWAGSSRLGLICREVH